MFTYKTKTTNYKANQLPTVSREEFKHLFDVDKLFEEIFGETFSNQFGINFFDKQSYPKVDIIDEGTSVKIEAEIPGLTKDDVSVEVEDSTLTIKGNRFKRDRGSDETDKTYIRREIKKSSFVRSFVLGESYELDKITADFDHGLLKIDIPKKEEVLLKSKKRKIL